MSTTQAENNTTQDATQPKKRVQLDHLLLDVDFFDKPKIIALDYKFGAMGSAFLVRLYAKMSGATNGEIPIDSVRALAHTLKFKKINEFLNYCFSLEIISSGSSDLYVTNSRVIEDQERCAIKRAYAKNRKEEWERRRTENALRTRSPDTDTATVTVDPIVTDLSKVILTPLPSTTAAPPEEIPKEESKISIAPSITMTRKQALQLVEEFGKEACEYYKPICSDYLLSRGKRMKNCAAFMRNWIRKEIAERKGFYYPKPEESKFQPHTAATTVQKNLNFLKDKYGSEGARGLLDSVINSQKKLGNERDHDGSLVPSIVGPPKRRGDECL